MEYKLVVLVRKDLNLPKGKLAAQVGHAAVDTVAKAEPSLVSKWKADGGKKVVLYVENEKELFLYKQKAEDVGLTTKVIQDAGHTVVAPGTKTCLGIGPDEEGKIDAVTGNLKMV